MPDGTAWPPDHYTLLGLRPGEADEALFEERALERMERLRAYQLQHPDTASAGMRQLALAMDCLSDPDRRRAYDQALARDRAADVPPKPAPGRPPKSARPPTRPAAAPPRPPAGNRPAEA